MSDAAEFHYRVGWRSRAAFPGAHTSTQSGGGMAFSHHVPLISAPDPRRLDLHATLKNPFDDWQVRRFRQRSGVTVYVLADVSASMGFTGARRKLDVLADFAAAAGYSAYRSGDRFGFIGCDERLREDFFVKPGQRQGAGADLADRLRRYIPDGRHAGALLEAPAHLARTRSLVFVVSDFHFPLEWCEALLAGLARHEVVPIVLWDRAEVERLPRFGFAHVRDPETGATRVVLMRRKLRADIARAFAERRGHLERLFARHEARALHLLDGFNADQITQHFFATIIY